MKYEHFQNVESRFADLLQDLRGVFSSDENEEVIRFINVAEYGLALETLCGIIVDGEHRVAKATYESIVELGTIMEVDESYWAAISVV